MRRKRFITTSVQSTIDDMFPGDEIKVRGTWESAGSDIRSGVIVRGGPDRATLKMPASTNGHARVLQTRPTATRLPGLIENINFDGNIANQTFTAGDEAHRHTMLYLGSVANAGPQESWVLRNLDMRDSGHMGVFIDDKVVVLLDGLTGANCAWGELAITGAGSYLLAKNLGTAEEPLYINHECESNGDPNKVQFSMGFFRVFETLQRNVGDMVQTVDSIIYDQIHLQGAEDSDQVSTLFSNVDAHTVAVGAYRGELFDIVNAGAITFENCTLATGGLLVRFQTSSRVAGNQSITFDGGSIDGLIWVRGTGVIDFVGDVAGPAFPGAWLYVDATEVGTTHNVDVRINGVNVAYLTAVGHTWAWPAP